MSLILIDSGKKSTYSEELGEHRSDICWACKTEESGYTLYAIVDGVEILHQWARREKLDPNYICGYVCSEMCFNLLLLQGGNYQTREFNKPSRSGTFEKNHRCPCGMVHNRLNEYGYSFGT